MRRKHKKHIDDDTKNIIVDLSSLMTSEIDTIIENLKEAKLLIAKMPKMRTSDFVKCRKTIVETRDSLTSMSKTILETRNLFTEERK